MAKISLYICALLTITALSSVWVSSHARAQERASDNYQISRDSLNSGGLDQSGSANYQLADTVGEQATGESGSDNFQVQAGYRQVTGGNISITAVPESIELPPIGGVSGGSSESTGDVIVTTDNPAGYELSVRSQTSPALQNQTDPGSFADYDAGAAPDYDFSIAASESAFGFTPEGSDVVAEYLDDGADCGTGSQETASACWRGFTTSDEVISSAAENNQPDGTETTVRYRAESGEENSQTAGEYEATIVLTGVTL